MNKATLEEMKARLAKAEVLENTINTLTNAHEELLKPNLNYVGFWLKPESRNHLIEVQYSDDKRVQNVCWSRYFPEIPGEIREILTKYLEDKLKKLKEEYVAL